MNPYSEDNEPRYTASQVRQMMANMRESFRIVTVIEKRKDGVDLLRQIIAIRDVGHGIEVVIA